MFGLNSLLWAFICHVTAFATVDTGSFCFAVMHFGLTGHVGLGLDTLLGRGLSLACIPGR